MCVLFLNYLIDENLCYICVILDVIFLKWNDKIWLICKGRQKKFLTIRIPLKSLSHAVSRIFKWVSTNKSRATVITILQLCNIKLGGYANLLLQMANNQFRFFFGAQLILWRQFKHLLHNNKKIGVIIDWQVSVIIVFLCLCLFISPSVLYFFAIFFLRIDFFSPSLFQSNPFKYAVNTYFTQTLTYKCTLMNVHPLWLYIFLAYRMDCYKIR